MRLSVYMLMMLQTPALLTTTVILLNLLLEEYDSNSRPKQEGYWMTSTQNRTTVLPRRRRMIRKVVTKWFCSLLPFKQFHEKHCRAWFQRRARMNRKEMLDLQCDLWRLVGQTPMWYFLVKQGISSLILADIVLHWHNHRVVKIKLREGNHPFRTILETWKL